MLRQNAGDESATESISEEERSDEDIVSFDAMDLDEMGASDDENLLDVSFDGRDIDDIGDYTHQNAHALAAIGAFPLRNPMQPYQAPRQDAVDDEDNYGAGAGFTSTGHSWR